jgi:hypothetical protein
MEALMLASVDYRMDTCFEVGFLLRYSRVAAAPPPVHERALHLLERSLLLADFGGVEADLMAAAALFVAGREEGRMPWTLGLEHVTGRSAAFLAEPCACVAALEKLPDTLAAEAERERERLRGASRSASSTPLPGTGISSTAGLKQWQKRALTAATSFGPPKKRLKRLFWEMAKLWVD